MAKKKQSFTEKYPILLFLFCTLGSLVVTLGSMILILEPKICLPGDETCNFVWLSDEKAGNVGGLFQGSAGVAAAIAGAIVTIILAKIAIDLGRRSNEIAERQEKNENPVFLEAHKLADARERVCAGIVTILLYKKNIDELDQRSTNKLQENAFQDLETKLANKRTEIELSEGTIITNVMEDNESYHSAEKKMEAKLNRLRKEEQELIMLNESRILFSTSFKTYAETWGSTLLDNLIILNPSIYKVIESSSDNMEDSQNVISNIGEWIYQAANFQSSLDALKTRESINYSSMLFTSGVALIKFLQSDKFTDFINIALGNKDDGKKIAKIKARLISDSLIKDLDLYAEIIHKQANIQQ